MIDATSSRGLGVSEDRQFLQIDEEKTAKAGEHYVVPHPSGMRIWKCQTTEGKL